MKKLLSLLVLCCLCIGSAWGASGETHGVTNVAFSQLLNGGVSISDVKITNPGYAISKVVLNCNYNKTAGGVTISVTVGGKSFGSSVTFNEKATKDISFTDAPASGNIVISFKNNCTASTGCGTFYLNSVTLTEGDASPKINVGENATITPSASAQDVKFYYTIENAQDDDAQVTATVDCDWIENLTLGTEEGNKKYVQFHVTENTSVNDRSATITLLYEEGTTTTQEVTIKQAGVVPVITLDADAFTPTAMDGECGTGVSVAPTVAGYELVANANVDWIKNIAIANDQITFAVDPNSGEARQGTITLTYQPSNPGGVNPLTFTKVITVNQASAGYTVTIETPENGTLEVKNGDAVVESGTMIEAGTTLTITATPNEGYKFRNWQYNAGDRWNTKTSGLTYEVKSNVSFRANFDALAEYAVNFYSVGTPINETAYPVFEGQTVESVKPDFDVPAGWTLSGWTIEGTFGNGSAAPDMYDITATLPALEEGASNEINLYAVYTQNITGVGESAWKLVTDESTLKAGDKVIIAADGNNEFAMSTVQNDNNRGTAPITKTGNTCTIESTAQQFILEEGMKENTFSFNTGSGYIYAASSNSNYLKTQTSKSDNSSWEITISNGVTSIVAQGTNTHNVLKYNSNSSCFSCYTGGQQPVCLYRYEVGSMPIYAVAELPTAFNMTTQDVYTTLAAAVEAVEGTATIKMIANEETAAAIEIPAGKNITLDLNDKTISASAAFNTGVIRVHNGATLTIDDFSASKTGAIDGNGKAYAAVAVTANNDDATVPATLVVNNGMFEGMYYGIVGNGLRHNTDITINGGSFSGEYAIYHPQSGDLTITGGEFTGNSSAIEMRAGNLVIEGGTFTATATFAEQGSGNGTTIEGAAIAVSQHSTNKDLSVAISGGTFTGAKAIYEKDYQDANVDNISMSIEGGQFNGDVYSQNCDNFISAGTYSVRPTAEYVAEGKVAIPNEDGTYLWTVVDGEENANLIQTWEQGTTYAYVQSGDEVTLKESDETLGKLTNIEIKENIENVNVTYERTFKNTEWQSLYVPFEIKLTSDLLEKYEFAYINDNHLINTLPQIEYIELENGLLKANHPYLICAELADAEKPQTIEFGTVDLCKTESKTIDCSSTSAMFNFVGVYDQTAQSTIVEQDEAQPYVMSGGKFIKLKEDANVAPYRFYMTIIARQGCEQFITLADEIKLVNAFGDDFDEADAINEIKSETVREGAYDLMGRKVTSLVKGNVYIINGKKTLFK
ncbi:MAG: hypothetical protein MJY95_03075 [Bacteroidaceae bacterium]|nr:hypothetical protein [Bacteroidaceae bacterium]